MVLGQNISNLGEEYYEMLEAAGLLIPDFGSMDLPSLYDDRSQGALDEIQSRLGATADDFGSTLAGAFDTDNLEDFRAKLKAGVKDSIRQAMIAAFLESAAIKPLLDALSQGVLDAMADGTLSGDEKDYLLGLQASLGIASEEFFGVLDELGLGFSDLNESLGEVNESLTNVPQGFRVALRRYQSDDPTTQPVTAGSDDDDEYIKPVQPRDPQITARDPFEGVEAAPVPMTDPGPDIIEIARDRLSTWEGPRWQELVESVFGTGPFDPTTAMSNIFMGEDAERRAVINRADGLFTSPGAPAAAAPAGALAAVIGRISKPNLPPSSPPPAASQQLLSPSSYNGATFVFQTHEGFDTDSFANELERKGAARGMRLTGSRVAVKK